MRLDTPISTEELAQKNRRQYDRSSLGDYFFTKAVFLLKAKADSIDHKE